MQDKDQDLSVYRLSLAKETLANVRMCLDNRFYRDCINRSYYAVFYSIKAIIKMMREESDYSDFFIVSEEDARKQYETAQYIIDAIEKYSAGDGNKK